MATPPNEQQRGARKSGHAGAMADAGVSVRVPAVLRVWCHVGAALRNELLFIVTADTEGQNGDEHFNLF